ncbi:hypothetical protein F2P81_020858 [Scophthalmus maximus]|uniref:Uncharacterized protein n=1 Tax=Scophthalmus maximus TaxID=52904 RepID=A0A6A4S4Q7_SCOMX|nr:hypothetical protein F2P81_020858 [Scophthalmus maximus]
MLLVVLLLKLFGELPNTPEEELLFISASLQSVLHFAVSLALQIFKIKGFPMQKKLRAYIRHLDLSHLTVHPVRCLHSKMDYKLGKECNCSVTLNGPESIQFTIIHYSELRTTLRRAGNDRDASPNDITVILMPAITH